VTGPGRRPVPGLRWCAALLTALALALAGGAIRAGVKHGDAIPAIVKKSDFERIKSVLNLERFSVIAAVWLGATEGRELIIAEPISDADLERVKESCEAGRFCPDPVGFVGARVRVAVLDDHDITESLRIDSEARNPKGRLVDLGRLLPPGRLIGWNGRAASWSNHVALEITPILERSDGRIVAALDPPLTLRWNEAVDRFQFFDCVVDDAEEMRCAFEEEAEN
jgi:hypothetical protein